MLKSPAWWTLAITLVIAIGSSMLTSARVESKTDTRVVALEKQVPAMEQRIMDRLDDNNAKLSKDLDEARTDIREIRGILLNRR